MDLGEIRKVDHEYRRRKNDHGYRRNGKDGFGS